MLLDIAEVGTELVGYAWIGISRSFPGITESFHENTSHGRSTSPHLGNLCHRAYSDIPMAVIYQWP